MSTLPIVPRRVEWAGPEGWTVWADEDGVFVRSRQGDTLEPGDVTRLMALVTEARSQMASGQVPAPAPLGGEEVRALYAHEREQYAARRAARAIKREFSPDEEGVPF